MAFRQEKMERAARGLTAILPSLVATRWRCFEDFFKVDPMRLSSLLPRVLASLRLANRFFPGYALDAIWVSFGSAKFETCKILCRTKVYTLCRVKGHKLLEGTARFRARQACDISSGPLALEKPNWRQVHTQRFFQ